MPGEPENLVLVYLRRIDDRQERMEAMLVEHGQRLNRMEMADIRATRQQADDAESRALVQVQIDRMRSEIDRIRRRPDLSD